MPSQNYIIGNSTGTDLSSVTAAGDNLYATVEAPSGGPGWAYELVGRVQNPGSVVSATMALYESTGDPATSNRIGMSSAVTIATNSSILAYTFTLTAPVLIDAAKTYAVALQCVGALNLANLTSTSTAGPVVWSRNTAASPPPTPFGAAFVNGSTSRLIPSLYASVETNVAPDAPVSLVPASGAVVQGLTPTFSFSHVDANTDAGDKMIGATLVVERVSDGAVLWSPYLTATSAQQSSGTMSVVYGGSALVPGTSYRWYVRTQDRLGIYGPYSTTQSFTVTSLGTVTMTGPATKTEVNTGNTFTATWSHGSALALTKARARLAIGGSVVWEGAASGFTPATGNVANGGTLTFTQALAGMPTLSAGVTYQVAVMGQDTNLTWSPYSPYRNLRTNAPPNTPAALNPNTTQSVSVRPLLTFTAQDPDAVAGFPEADLTASVRLKDSAGVVRFTRAATLADAAAGTWQYQVTATDEPALAAGASVSRLWDAQVNDGTTTSAWSAQATYVYASGPVVTITAPGATMTNATGPVTWTVVGTQIDRTVKIWAGASTTGTLVHLWTTTTGSLSYTIPAGVIFNGNTYTIAVEVVDSAGLTGSSPTVTTTATFPVPPAVAGATASLVAATGEPDPSRVLLSWQASTQPPDVFVRYRITRRFSADTSTAAVILASLVNPSQVSLTDHHPPTGGDLIYAISQVTRDANGYELLGAVTEISIAALNLDALYLVQVVDSSLGIDPLRVALRFPESVDVASDRGRIEVETWAGGPSLILPTGSRRKVASVTANVIDDKSRPTLMKPAETMALVRALDASDNPVSVRDGRRPRWFAVLEASESDRRIGASDVSLTLTEVILTEGTGV